MRSILMIIEARMARAFISRLKFRHRMQAIHGLQQRVIHGLQADA